MKDKHNPSEPEVISSAAAMSFGTLASRVVGLFRDIVLSHYFSKTITDAFFVAFRLPNLLRIALGEGALSVSLIPVFVDELKSSPSQAQKFSNSLYTLLMIVVSTLTVLGVVFMQEILLFVVNEETFNNPAGKLALAVQMGQVIFCYLFFVVNFAYFMAILNSLKSFFVPAVAPMFFNVTLIGFAFLNFQVRGMELAWGVLVAGAVQFSVVFFQLYKKGFLPKISFEIHPKVKLVFKNMLPGILGLGVLQLISLINLYFASLLQEGTISYIYYADRILGVPQSLLAVSLGAALLPKLSFQDKSKITETLSKNMQFFLFLALPSALGIFLLADPIIKLFFMGGEFNLQDAKTTAWILKIYSFIILSFGLSRVFSSGFYAVKNTKTPALCAVFTVVFHIVMSIFLVNEWQLTGLIVATVLSSFFNMFLLFMFYRFHFLSFPKLQTVPVLKMLVALFIMGAILWAFLGLSLKSLAYQNLFFVVFGVGLGALVYLSVTRFLKVSESTEFLKLLSRKTKR